PRAGGCWPPPAWSCWAGAAATVAGRGRGPTPCGASTSWPASSAAAPGPSAPATTARRAPPWSPSAARAGPWRRAGGAEPRERVVWEQQESYGQALAAVERRVYSHPWRLPDEVFETATRRLRAEVEAAHPDLDRPQAAPHEFTLTAVRFGTREVSRAAGRGAG